MSFIFSRALVEASLQVNCSVVDAYAPLSLIPTPKRSSSRAKTTAPFLRSRYGMTFEPLTDDHGAELLALWLVASRVKTSAQPEPVTGLMAREAGSGPKWLGSFARYDLSESKWKTAQCSLLGDSDEFSETWPRWGSMRNGESFLRPIPALPICESASGLWQTPVADDAIERAAGKWNSRGEPKLSAEVKLWPTPCAQPANGTPARFLERKREWVAKGSAMGITLSDLQLAAVASERGMEGRGQLNPTFVEWLMGWPIGHTALEPLATDKYREWLQQHGGYSVNSAAAAIGESHE
nr:hypothetical protein [Ralstonia mannitolilytica]